MRKFVRKTGTTSNVTLDVSAVLAAKVRFFPENKKDMAVNFYIEKRLSKEGEAPIRCSISIQGKRLITTTGSSINPECWDSTAQRVCLSHGGKAVVNSKGVSARQLNTKLKEIDAYFSTLENQLWVSREEVGDLKAIFNRQFGKKKSAVKNGKQDDNSFFAVYDRFREEMAVQKDWTPATIGKFKSLKNHLEEYNSNLTFEELDETGLSNFIVYLRDTCCFRNSTTLKVIGFLKWFLRWASTHGYCTDAGFRAFSLKLKTSEKKVVFLDWDELMLVYKFEFPEKNTKLKLKDIHGKEYEKETSIGKETLEHVRDLFCFCCFTSLRYSDMANLRRSSVFPGFIQITTQKTSDMLKIELNDYSQAILDKYKDQVFPYNRALPVISNQRMNDYIKEMGEICGLNSAETVTYYKGNQRFDEVYPKYSLLGTHTGRRTFICNALMLGISPQMIMKWTGHSDYKAMKPYIDITDAAKADAMKKFNKSDII